MSESWGNNADQINPFKLGAVYRPAPPQVPMLRATTVYKPLPTMCRWDRDIDLVGEDGLPDALGNNDIGNCVPCAGLRQMQLWTGDGRKPTVEQANMLLASWQGSPTYGMLTDVAFGIWSRQGFRWSDQRLIVPRWTVVEADGAAPDFITLKEAIHLLGGVLAVFQMPKGAMQVDRWDEPRLGTPDSADIGAHCVLLAGYDAASFYAVSWGHSIPVSYAFIRSRLKQASAFVSDSWCRAGRSPSGLTFDEIKGIGARLRGV